MDNQLVADLSYIILDFETVTQKGHPPEPVELGAMRIVPPGRVDPAFVVDWLIQPPPHAPITPAFTASMGIHPQDVAGKPKAAAALRNFAALLHADADVLMAHNAAFDASILKAYAQACPHLMQMPFLDTLKLARHLLPQLRSHGLDALADHFDFPIPYNRHRALPDVRLTCAIFLQLLQLWKERYHDQRFRLLHRVAGIKTAPPPTQPSLFS